MKRVLITGGAGFIGSHLIENLIEKDYHITVIDDLSTGNLALVNDSVEFYNRNLYLDDIEGIFNNVRPHIVFHLAAESSVAKSVDNPLLNAQRNITATINVLECARNYLVEKLIFTSSAAVYGTPQQLPITEDHVLSPLSPYGLSKKTCEEYIRMYNSLYGLNYTIFRLANIYGVKDDLFNAEDVTSSMLSKCLKEEPIYITGNGAQTRDFVNVHDTVIVLEKSIRTLENQTYNLSSGIEISIEELYLLLQKYNPKMADAHYVEDREGDISRSVLDNSRLQTDLGVWEPQYTLEDGIAEIVRQTLLVNQ